MKVRFFLLYLLVPLASFGQTDVISRNVVGYYRVDMQRGEIRMLTYPFFCVSVTNTVDPTPMNTVWFNSVPPGTCLYFWDAAVSMYRSEVLVSNVVTGLKWVPNKNLLIPGKGFWVKIPSFAPSNQYSIYLMGELPDAYTAPTTTVDVLPGMNMLGYPYPTDALWTNLNIAKTASRGDIAYIYSNGYRSCNCLSTNGGVPLWMPTTFCLRVGEGFWYKSRAETTRSWEEAKPYSWP